VRRGKTQKAVATEDLQKGKGSVGKFLHLQKSRSGRNLRVGVGRRLKPSPFKTKHSAMRKKEHPEGPTYIKKEKGTRRNTYKSRGGGGKKLKVRINALIRKS